MTQKEQLAEPLVLLWVPVLAVARVVDAEVGEKAEVVLSHESQKGKEEDLLPSHHRACEWMALDEPLERHLVDGANRKQRARPHRYLCIVVAQGVRVVHPMLALPDEAVDAGKEIGDEIQSNRMLLFG